MTKLGADGDLDSRVSDLIERGLSAYGSGDLDAAMSFWKHALALDPDSSRARDYVGYVKRHFHFVDEAPAADAFASAESELDLPFGLAVLAPAGEFDADTYESLESAVSGGELSDMQRARLDSVKVDEGWSLSAGDLDLDDLVETREHRPVPRPTYDMDRLDDIGTGRLADVLEPDDDGLEDAITRPLTTGDDLEEQLAAVTEGLLIAESGAIEAAAAPVPAVGPARPAHPPKSTVFGLKPTIRPATPTLRGVAEPGAQPPRPAESEPAPWASPGGEAEPLELELDLGPRAPARGGPPGDIELELASDNTPETADVETPPGLDGLDLDDSPFSALPVDDLALDLGPVPAVEATPLPPELGAPMTGLDLELGKAGAGSPPPADVEISFRDPADPGGASGISPGADHHDAGEIDIGIEAVGLEDQLAELEAEMRDKGSSLEWQTHDSSAPIGSLPDVELSRPPEVDRLRKLPRRQPTVLPDSGDVAETIRAEIEQGAPASESVDQRLRRRIEGYIDRADIESRRENYSIAVVAADLALSEGPETAIAQKLVHQSHDLLVEVFRRYLGDLTGVPAVALPMHEISMQELDHRTAFLLSRIDGTLSFEDILDVSGMPRLEALRYLCRLRLQGILEVR